MEQQIEALPYPLYMTKYRDDRNDKETENEENIDSRKKIQVFKVTLK